MKWLQRLRERNSRPLPSVGQSYAYDLGDLPLPQPWRKDAQNVYFLPTEFVLKFTDRQRMALLRASEPEYLAELAQDMLTYGIKTPMELWLDSNGKLRLQEGHHRMCVVDENRDRFLRVPVILNHSKGIIRSYGRSVYEELPFILETLSKRYE